MTKRILVFYDGKDLPQGLPLDHIELVRKGNCLEIYIDNKPTGAYLFMQVQDNPTGVQGLLEG